MYCVEKDYLDASLLPEHLYKTVNYNKKANPFNGPRHLKISEADIISTVSAYRYLLVFIYLFINTFTNIHFHKINRSATLKEFQNTWITHI